ncbi:MAG: Holliday junction branch migration protein RuvA [Ignavibacteriaceae bacterium]|nr:Holliday junction branch migration protein RuvA [Ignavibacteriaceae bacterium]
MIGYLKGEIFSAAPTRLVIDVNGVGYLVNISLNTFEAVSGKKTVQLYISTIVREDSISLYGFSDEEEKAMFELLISVSGIGAKSALSILSGIRAEELRRTITHADTARLSTIPGIGKKTAERLVLELREKVDAVPSSAAGAAPAGIRSEAVSALIALGYNQKNAEQAVRDILGTTPDISIEELLKTALRKFASR